MTKETFRIADNTIAAINEPGRKERIRQDLRELILDLDRKFEAVLQLKEKYEAGDGCQTAEEGVVVLDRFRTSRSKRRATVHATCSSPPRLPRHLFLYGQSHYAEVLARRHHDRQAFFVPRDNDDGDDCIDKDDDDSSFCSLDSTKVRSGKKRSSQRIVRTETKEDNRESETCDILEFVPLSPVDTMITWREGETCLVVEDHHDDDPRIKRRCSSFF